MGLKAIAGLWGFAEATLFFIVPDVWLSIVGRKNLKTGLWACLYSLAGALLGGLLMYVWGSADLIGAVQLLANIPAISLDMIDRVHQNLNSMGVLAIMAGPFSGTPYKIYAVQANATGINLFMFMLISIPARLIRFALVTSLLHYAHKGLCVLLRKDDCLGLLIIGWVLFYGLYFFLMLE